jgi:hypothetical protein
MNNESGELMRLPLGGSMLAVEVPPSWTSTTQIDPDRIVLTDPARASDPTPGPMLLAVAVATRGSITSIPDLIRSVAFGRTDFTIVESARSAGGIPVVTATFRQGPFTFVSMMTGWAIADELVLLELLCMIEEFGAIQDTLTSILASAEVRACEEQDVSSA